MKIRTLVLAGLAVGLLATAALADEAAPAPASGKESEAKLGEKE